MRGLKKLTGQLFVLCLLAFVARSATADVIAFRAGAAKVDITPENGVSLEGAISKNGLVEGVNDRLHARAIVFADESMALAIVVCDLCMIARDVIDEAKQQIHRRTDFPIERICIAATHTHAAPRAVHIGTGAKDDDYHRKLPGWIADAVIQAQKNLRVARVGFGRFERPELINCRRHLCKPGTAPLNPFGVGGERIKSVSARSGDVIEPAGPTDPQFSILSVQHADGTPLAVLGNFSVHYCGGYKRGIVSADYFGHYSAALEAAFATKSAEKKQSGRTYPPFVGIMSNGTSGNTGAIEKGGRKYKPFEWLTLAGRMLAEHSVDIIKETDHQAEVSLGMKQLELELQVRRPDEARIAWAKNVLARPDEPLPHRWSKVYAQEAMHLSKYPATKKIILQSIRIGDIAIATAPCEVFAETGVAIKQESPFAKTFTIELANGYGGYLPPAEQHKLGGYETWPARSSHLEVDAEKKIRNELVTMLKKLQE